MINGDKALLDKKLLRKRLIFIDEIINKIYSLTHLDNFLGFMIWFIIIFLIDIIIILWLYSNKGDYVWSWTNS